jgi:AraC-like DNA-binding protein
MAELCAPDERYVFRTSDLAQAREFLDSNGFTLEVARRERKALDLFIDSEDLQNTSVLYMQRGAAAGLVRNDRGSACGDYWVVLPLREAMEGSVGGRSVSLAPTRGMVTTAGRRFAVNTKGRGATFNIGFPESLIRQRLASLLGEDAQAALEFAPSIELSIGLGNGLARHVHHMMGNFLDGRSIFKDVVMAASLEDAIICELLLRHPNNFSRRLARLERNISPRDVRRAVEYIEANLNTAITISDIVQAANVAGRTLFRHFQDVRGTSPMQYIRELRFEKARQALLRADPEGSVTDIALRFGFGHLGRFSVEYRRRFGELPSATLGKRRPGSS